jgi:hypothetical protein
MAILSLSLKGRVPECGQTPSRAFEAPIRFGEWFYRALALLIIACHCALVISTPVTVVFGIKKSFGRPNAVIVSLVMLALGVILLGGSGCVGE